jgi:hypothetical protein
MFSSDRKDTVSAQFGYVESLLQPDSILKCKQGCLYFLFFHVYRNPLYLLFFPLANHESGGEKTLFIDFLKVNWVHDLFRL